MNKYVRNWIWNRTTRYGLLLKYYWNGEHRKKFPNWAYPYKRLESKKEVKEFNKELEITYKQWQGQCNE